MTFLPLREEEKFFPPFPSFLRRRFFLQGTISRKSNRESNLQTAPFLYSFSSAPWIRTSPTFLLRAFHGASRSSARQSRSLFQGNKCVLSKCPRPLTNGPDWASRRGKSSPPSCECPCRARERFSECPRIRPRIRAKVSSSA